MVSVKIAVSYHSYQYQDQLPNQYCDWLAVELAAFAKEKVAVVMRWRAEEVNQIPVETDGASR